MFTGLIEGTGKLVKVEPRGKDMRLSIQASFDLEELKTGESVSVDGACLTVVSWEGRTFTVDVSQETLERTTLGQRGAGDEVNLERALKLGDRLGGHLVNGHVDGRAGWPHGRKGVNHWFSNLRFQVNWAATSSKKVRWRSTA